MPENIKFLIPCFRSTIRNFLKHLQTHIFYCKSITLCRDAYWNDLETGLKKKKNSSPTPMWIFWDLNWPHSPSIFFFFNPAHVGFYLKKTTVFKNPFGNRKVFLFFNKWIILLNYKRMWSYGSSFSVMLHSEIWLKILSVTAFSDRSSAFI